MTRAIHSATERSVLTIVVTASLLFSFGPLRIAGAQETTAASTISETGRQERVMSSDLTRMVRAAAYLYDLDPALMTAIARVESGDDPVAASSRGAIGLMQLMPATAARFGVINPADPVENLLGAARFLSYLRQSAATGRTLPEVLAAYNAGEGAVAHYGGIPPYPETQSYVRKVLIAYLTQPVSDGDPRDPGRAPSTRKYSANDGAAEDKADPFRQLELIQRNRALAAKPRTNGNQTAGK
ncbi:MAG TPA: lytic transglycosylase domain-containing protein [Candidatus Binataceae bacterium]|nr:lytic transglycosylase domain-containing protein [Candidatus Binataceae bacterium]